MGRVLVVDDQQHVLDALTLLFQLRGIDAAEARTPARALELVRAGGIDVVIQDMNFSSATTSGQEGAALFRAIRAIDATMPVMLMTAWSSLEMAVTLVKEGADDYLEKPWNDEKLLRKVEHLLRTRAAAQRTDDVDLCGLVYASAAMRTLVSLAAKVAPSDAPVLITGPNGSGKERIAHIVHANSRRKRHPLVEVDLGSLPDELFTAEFFGAEPGAFTGARRRRVGRFEEAHGGTLFLDEIGNLGWDSQAALLRVLETGRFQRLGCNDTRAVDVRIIAATNARLTQRVTDGTFRQDLYYRLAVIELAVPPLAARPDDIRPLAEHFVRQFASERPDSRPISLSEPALRALAAHDWPGNVRELRNCIRRAVLLGDAVLTPADLGLPPGVEKGRADTQAGATTAAPTDNESVALSPLEQAERDTIQQALRANDHVVSRAARALGLSRQALYRRMQRLDLSVKRESVIEKPGTRNS